MGAPAITPPCLFCEQNQHLVRAKRLPKSNKADRCRESLSPQYSRVEKLAELYAKSLTPFCPESGGGLATQRDKVHSLMLNRLLAYEISHLPQSNVHHSAACWNTHANHASLQALRYELRDTKVLPVEGFYTDSLKLKVRCRLSAPISQKEADLVKLFNSEISQNSILKTAGGCVTGLSFGGGILGIAMMAVIPPLGLGLTLTSLVSGVAGCVLRDALRESPVLSLASEMFPLELEPLFQPIAEKQVCLKLSRRYFIVKQLNEDLGLKLCDHDESWVALRSNFPSFIKMCEECSNPAEIRSIVSTSRKNLVWPDVPLRELASINNV